ncbi:MAG: hypothetical protein GZ094_01270 [Mariniphaga sp.]|nr:hypothetical protein [Mariniphaga sp.]
MKRDQYEEDLIDQARIFYYSTCFKLKSRHFVANRFLSEVGPTHVTLKDSKGLSFPVRYNSTHLYIEMGGIEYCEPIKTHNQLLRHSAYGLFQLSNK